MESQVASNPILDVSNRIIYDGFAKRTCYDFMIPGRNINAGRQTMEEETKHE